MISLAGHPRGDVIPNQFRPAKLVTEPEGGGSICMEGFQAEIEGLLAAEETGARDRAILQELLSYADDLLA